MIELRFEAEIHASAERVFDLLADLRGYDHWLPHSTAFHGTAEISDGPIGAGTTYVEPSPYGIRRGLITAFGRPAILDFEQPMALKPAILGAIGIKLFHRLMPTGDGVRVVRRLELTPQGPIRLASPLIVKAFRGENERMLQRLKNFIERDEPSSPDGHV